MLKILNNLERSVFFNEMKLLFLYIFFVILETVISLCTTNMAA